MLRQNKLAGMGDLNGAVKPGSGLTCLASGFSAEKGSFSAENSLGTAAVMAATMPVESPPERATM